MSAVTRVYRKTDTRVNRVTKSAPLNKRRAQIAHYLCLTRVFTYRKINSRGVCTPADLHNRFKVLLSNSNGILISDVGDTCQNRT